MKYDFTFKQVVIENFDVAAKELEQLGVDHCDLKGFNIIKPEETLSKLPTILTWLRKHNLTVDLTAFLQVAANARWNIHIDHGEYDVALNLPISGCMNASTRFYKFNEVAQTTLNLSVGTAQSYLEYHDPNPQIIDVYYLTRPALLNIKMPHTVVNPTAVDRVCLSLRFRQDESFDTWIDSML